MLNQFYAQLSKFRRLIPAVLSFATAHKCFFYYYLVSISQVPGGDAAIQYIFGRGRNQSLHHTQCCCAVEVSGGDLKCGRLNSIPRPTGRSTDVYGTRRQPFRRNINVLKSSLTAKFLGECLYILGKA